MPARVSHMLHTMCAQPCTGLHDSFVSVLQFGIDPSAPLDSTSIETLSEAYASDPSWSKQGEACWQDPGSGIAGRLVAQLFNDAAPKAVDNFVSLCTGEKGLGKASKKPLHYKVRFCAAVVMHASVHQRIPDLGCTRL